MYVCNISGKDQTIQGVGTISNGTYVDLGQNLSSEAAAAVAAAVASGAIEYSIEIGTTWGGALWSNDSQSKESVDAQTTNFVLGDGSIGTANLSDSLDLDSISGLTDNAASTLVPLTSESITADSLAAQSTTVATTQLSTKYYKSKARLADFTYTDGSDDDSRRAYMKLQGEVSSMSALVDGEDRELLQAVYQHLVTGYTSVIILSVQENLQERQHILPTVGDSFAATFSGAEPQVLQISGYLPYDGDRTSSWFLAFINAYKYFIRASKLAKYRCSLKLVFPDFTEYTCYPIAIGTSQNSENDMIIPFTMSAVVTVNPTNKAYGYSSTVLNPSTTVEDVKQATSETTKASNIEKEVTKTASEVGKESQNKSWVDSVSDWVQSAKTSTAVQAVNKTLSVANQVSGAIDIATGGAYGQRYYSGKIGRGTYD